MGGLLNPFTGLGGKKRRNKAEQEVGKQAVEASL